MTTTGASEATAAFDPHELEDTVVGSVRDPFPRFAELLEESPVHVGPVDLGTGADEQFGPVPPVTVLGFDECVQVLRDSETFSSTVYEGVMGEVMGRTILQMDEPEHRMQRALVSPAFRSKMLEKWEEALVRTVVNELVDGFAGRGHADLVREVTFDFPVQVIARILGLPRSDYPAFQRWAVEIISVAANWERGVAASGQLRDYFAGVLAERRRHPDDDLITELVNVEVDGQRLTDEEIYSFLRLLLPAGVETTYRASGSLLYGLLTHPDQLAAVREDRSLLPQALEEAVRWEPPVTIILRRATRDTELAGVPVAEGADVALLLGAANHDRRKYENPDEFDMFRTVRQHVGFGFGVHVCLGMHLARMETRVALNTLFDRLPDMRFDPEPGEDPHIMGLAFRSPTSLPVSFTPS
ncbi:MAG: cytochrome P450 [Acidimicrobiales bacterium]